MDQLAMPTPAHVIVLGNEKGGTGKSTIALHIIVALIKQGRRVASIDTDSRQLSLTRYLQNRARWSRKMKLNLELPAHFSVRPGSGDTISAVEDEEYAAFREIVTRLIETVEFIVIDTPANDSHRMRLAHAMADTLVTPINDSFLDLDGLGLVDPNDLTVKDTGQYAEVVRTARRDRHLSDQGDIDWVVVRNRLAMLPNRNQVAMLAALNKLAGVLEFRVAAGVSERIVFRDLFPVGLTAFDHLDRKTLGVQPTPSHVAARREISELLTALQLPQVAPVVDEDHAAESMAAAE